VYCVECGFLNSDAARFCAKCGTLLASDEPGAQTTMSFEPHDEEGEGGAAGDAAAAGPALVIRAGGGRAGEHISLASDRQEIGRSPDSAVLLDDVTVSRHHATVERGPDGLYVVDLESLNGTYVNRRRVERHRLRDGDELQIGKFKLTFRER
jgi:hypothetical protein